MSNGSIYELVTTPMGKSSDEKKKDTELLEQSTYYEKRIYDLEQLLDIAQSFCSTLDFSTLLESIVYICMAQMHVLGAEIFVRDPITNDVFNLETSNNMDNGKKISIPVNDSIASELLETKKPVTFAELQKSCSQSPYLYILENLSPTLIVPLIEKTNHLSGILILRERIVIDDDTSYTDYEQKMIMSIAKLATVAINNASLMEMSSTDMMTHLRLKYYFFNQLADAIDKAVQNTTNIAVLMFDIDFFKKFNDTYGHECGDFVLISVANLIKTSLRESDIASRYGGEEFTVLLSNGTKEEAMKVAERIRKKIEEYDFVYNDQHLHVTVSVGVSVFDKKANPVELPNLFVNQADAGLYLSKNSGRNKVSFFDPSIHKVEEKNG